MNFINLDRLRPGLSRCPSDLALDRLVAEAMLPAEKQAALLHVECCEECTERIALRRKSFAAFPEVDEARLLSTIEGRLSESRAANQALRFLCQFAQRNPFE